MYFLGGAALAAIRPPNVLFLMCDSMDGRVLDPTSDIWPRLEMPNLRALAKAGTNFVRNYAAAPQCVPSRTTMLTGRHTHHISAWSNSKSIAASALRVDPDCSKYYDRQACATFAAQQQTEVQSTFFESVADAAGTGNCDVCVYGKVDVGAGVIEMQNSHTEPAAMNDATVDGWHGGPILTISGRGADIRRPTKPLPASITNDMDNNVHPEDHKMVAKCVEWLETRAKMQAENEAIGAADKSWMLYCSVNIPHPAFNTNATWLAMVNDDKFTVPTWHDKATFHPADAFMSISKNVWGDDYTNATILKTMRTYYAMCSETDYLMGIVIDAAKRLSLLDNTYVVFVSDHGEMNMEHRQVWKNSMYEASERVPFIVAAPYAPHLNVPANVVVKNVTSLLDVFPTLVEMVGGPNAKRPSNLDGYSLMPYLGGTGKPRPDFVVAQYHSNMGNTGSFMIVQGIWKLITFGTNGGNFNGSCGAPCTYPHQLFDVVNDPEELNDVATQTPGVVERLDTLLKSVVDYENVDAAAKAEDYMVYKRFFVKKLKDTEALKKAWGKGYKGFNDTDWAKVQRWAEDGEALLARFPELQQ